MPVTVASTARIANPGAWAARACPAIPSAVALYLCTQHTSTGKLSMWKSTNGTTWAEQDSANAPTNNSPTHPYSISDRIVSNLIGVGYFSAITTARVRRFNIAMDTWETTDVGNADAAILVSNSASIRVVLRSDGDVLLFHVSGTSIICARYEGSSWATTTITAVAGWILDAVIDGDDRTWISHFESSFLDVQEVSFSNANSVGGGTAFDASSHATNVRGVIGTFYNEGTNNRVAFMGRDSTGEIDLFGGITGGTTLGSGTVNTFMTTTTPQPTSASVIFFGVGSAGRLHLCWATANAIQRDFSNQAAPSYTFNTDVTVLSGLAVTDVCPQWIQGLGGRGISFQDGDVKIEWIVAPPLEVTGTSLGEGLAQGTPILDLAVEGTSIGTGEATAQAIIAHQVEGVSLGEGFTSASPIILKDVSGISLGLGASEAQPVATRVVLAQSLGEGFAQVAPVLALSVGGMSLGEGIAAAQPLIDRSVSGVSLGLGDLLAAPLLDLAVSGISLGEGSTTGQPEIPISWRADLSATSGIESRLTAEAGVATRLTGTSGIESRLAATPGVEG